jgi:subtilase family serine protease
MHRSHCVLVLAAFSALIYSLPGFSQNKPADRLTSPIVASQRTVTNLVHPLATKHNDLGRVAGTQVFHRMILLTQRSTAQEADLQQLLKDQQNPTSTEYHKWLTPTEFGARFGPSDNDLAKITGWLQSQGFTVEKPSNGRQILFFTGNSAQVETAFATEMHRYRVNGKTYVANAKPASIPSALAPAVTGVASLTSFTPAQPTYHTAAQAPQMKIGNGALTGPADLAAIYDAAPLQKANVLGQNQSIALIEESNINPQDVTDFRNITGLPAANLNVIVNGPDPGLLNDGEETEAIADVEYAGALDPDATLNVIVTASTDFNQGIDLSTVYAVDNLVSPITSLSYGGCETLNDTYSPGTAVLYSNAYEQGAAEGISHFVAVGDYGGDTCGYLGIGAGYGVNILGDSPWNVSVGGTEFIMPDPNVYFPPSNNYTATGYIPETTWNDYENPEDGRPLAGGGGLSIYYNSVTNPSLGVGKPAWQTGPGVPADYGRDVPDVSLVAGDNLAYMVCEADDDGDCSQGNAIGLIGTSLASPSWAGIQALVNQQNNLLSGAGNPNPTYYALAAGKSSPFHDITVGDTKVPDDCIEDLFVYCPGGSSDLVGYAATTGYDLATGLGSVDVNALATSWTPLTGSGTATVTLSIVGSTTITHGSPLTANINVSSGEATMPTGDAVVMAGTQGLSRVTLDASGNASAVFGDTSPSIPLSQQIELPGGSYNLKAHYAGDTNFAPSDSNTIALTVNPEATETVAAASVATASYGAPVTISAATYGTNSGTGFPVPGSYTFSENGTTLGTASLAGTGEAFAYATAQNAASLTLSGTALNAGMHLINVASPAASASFLASSTGTPVTITVTPASVLVSLTPVYTTPALNSTDNLAVTVQNLDYYGTPATGTVEIHDMSTNPYTVIAKGTLSGNSANLPVTFTTAGVHPIVAVYDGDPNNNANTSGAVDITVGGKTPTTTTFTPGIDFTYAPSPIALTVTVAGGSGGAAPTGTVTFTDATNSAGTTIGTQPLGSNGVATLSTTSLSPGTHDITASYSGDGNFNGSTATALQVSVISTTLTPASTSASISAGQTTQPMNLSFATNSIFTSYWYANINLSCSGLPTGASCIFASTAISPTYNPSSGVLSGSTSFSIYTQGPTLEKAANTLPRKPWSGAGSLALAGVLALFFRRRRLFTSLAAVALLACFLGLGGCGGTNGQYNISNQGTPAGTYPVMITGTMNDGAYGTFTTTTTFNLTVTAPGQ